MCKMLNQQKFVLFVSLLALTVKVIQADEVSTVTINNDDTNHLHPTTLAPAATKLIITSEAPDSHLKSPPPTVSGDISVTLAPINGHDVPTRVPILHSEGQLSLSSPPTTTGAPKMIAITPTGTSLHSPGGLSVSVKPTTSVVVSGDEEHHTNEATDKFSEYLKPICESVEKILPKQLLRIQSQFKQFVQQTNGKLGMCFMESYLFNPALKPLTKNDLILVCTSKTLAAEIKGSYKMFQKCATKNWDSGVDKELDRISAARINCIKNHQHTKNSTDGAIGLSHEDDDFSLIGELVSKVLDDDKSFVNNNSDIEVIDISGKSASKPISSPSISTDPPVGGEIHKAVKENTPVAPPSAKGSLMSDPNTVVVFLDDSSTTMAPSGAPVNKAIEKTVAKIMDHSTGSSNNSTIIAPVHIGSNTTTKPTTPKPAGLQSTTIKVFSSTSSEKPTAASVKPTATITTIATKGSSSVGGSSSIVKDEKQSNSTPLPSLAHKILPVASMSSTQPPNSTPAPISALASSSKPALIATLAPSSKPAPITTQAPSSKSSLSLSTLLPTTAKVNAAKVVQTTVKPISVDQPIKTTKKMEITVKETSKPAVLIAASVKPTIVSIATVKPTVMSVATSVKPTSLAASVGLSSPPPTATSVKPSEKPLETLEEILKRQEKEKQDLEIKLKAEREKIMKQLQKKQDEIDAQNAIKALQMQREASGHSSDNRLHQLEHERQMSIDPIGHTMKHQQYEMNKQQRMMAGRQ